MKFYKKVESVLLAVVIIFICLCVIFPIYWMVNTSFLKEVDLFNFPPKFFPSFPLHLKAYIDSLREGDILVWIKNSIIVAGASVVLNLILATLAAYSLSRFKFRSNNFLMLLVLVSQMIAPALVIAPIYIIFANLGINNTLLGLIIADTGLTLAFSTWILKGFFDEIPKELEEAALIDGCSQIGSFLKVSLSLVSPALITVAAITFFDVYNEYMFGLTLIVDQEKWVGSVGIASYVGHIATLWDSMMAGAAMFCISPLIVFLVLQRYIVKGITSGALKF
jgi:ABC-type glycerol-3-phosphate transport system permease component